jgi:peroxiredoxin
MGPVRRLLAGAALVVLLAACSATPAGSGGSSTPGTSTDKGYTSADGTTKVWATDARTGPVQLSGTDTAGAKQDVAAWRGDVVVVNTWYAACPPCRAEAPDLVALANADQAKGVHVIGVNSTDAAGTAAAFARQFSVPYPSIVDTDGSAVAALQGIVPVNATPTTLILDREGRVAARILGRLDPSTLSSIVDQLLAEGSTPQATTVSR